MPMEQKQGTEPAASMNLKDNLALDDRPREKALAQGFSALSPAELLAAIIGSGSQGENVVALCQRILNDHDGKLYNIARRSVSDLMREYRGVGEVKAIEILAAIELARRYQREPYEENPTIKCSSDAYNVLKPLLCDLDHEELWILTLNRATRVTDRIRVSMGGTGATLGDVKIILRRALERLADGIILAHNHPSDHAHPSDDDDKLTLRIIKGCLAVGIKLVDHLIVCRGGNYYSYNDHGRLDDHVLMESITASKAKSQHFMSAKRAAE